LPGESNTAFHWFTRYRDTPPGERSIRVLVGKKTSQLRQIQKYSSRFQWVARSQAWDDAIDERNRTARLEAVESMNRRHAAAAAIVYTKILQRAQGMSPLELTPQNIASLMVAAAKVEREALGVPSSIAQLQHAATEASGEPVPLLAWLAGRVAGEPDPEDA